MKKSIVLIGFVLIAVAIAMVNAQIPDSPTIRVLNLSDWDIHNVSNYIINQEPDPAEPGGYVEVRFKIENLGKGVAEDAIFELLPEFPFSLEPGDRATRSVGDIYSRQVAQDAVILYYKLRVAEDAVEGDNEIRLRYSLDNGYTWATLKPIDIRVQTHDIVLTVESVTSTPEIIRPGEKANLRIKLKNLADADVKNIKVNLQLLQPLQTATTLSYLESPFSPVGSSNEKTITSLSSQKFALLDFDLIADADAEAKVYKIPMTITYADKLGKNYTLTQLTSLVVGDVPDLVISLGESDLKSEGQTGEVNIKFVNKGACQVKFVYTILGESDSYTIVSAKDVYIGNIDSDDYETATFKLYLKEAPDSKVTLPLHVEYTDSSNKNYFRDITLEMPIYSGEELQKFGLQQKSSVWGYVIVVIVIVAGFIVYRKWKKKKKKGKK